MTIGEMFEKCDVDFYEFADIPDDEKLHPSPDLCGFIKLASLMKEPEKFAVVVNGDDEIHLADLSDIREGFTEEDALYLTRCGVAYNEFEEYFYGFTV